MVNLIYCLLIKTLYSLREIVFYVVCMVFIVPAVHIMQITIIVIIEILMFIGVCFFCIADRLLKIGKFVDRYILFRRVKK